MKINNNKSIYIWHSGEGLGEKLNNEILLNELAKSAKADIRTNLSQNSKYLPSDNVYFTTSRKKIDGKIFFGSDCVILSKDATKEKISDSIFKSAQNAVGKLYGNIAKFKAEQAVQNGYMQHTPKQKILNGVKKFLTILRRF